MRAETPPASDAERTVRSAGRAEELVSPLVAQDPDLEEVDTQEEGDDLYGEQEIEVGEEDEDGFEEAF